jgi:5-methylcytosine-specific restriction protein A
MRKSWLDAWLPLTPPATPRPPVRRVEWESSLSTTSETDGAAQLLGLGRRERSRDCRWQGQSDGQRSKKACDEATAISRLATLSSLHLSGVEWSRRQLPLCSADILFVPTPEFWVATFQLTAQLRPSQDASQHGGQRVRLSALQDFLDLATRSARRILIGAKGSIIKPKERNVEYGLHAAAGKPGWGQAMTFGGFEIGKTYNRRRHIHGKFRGQQQGGICTPQDYPVVIAFTGASGDAYGYADSWTPDGVYRYFGEGRAGNMTWKGGNVAIRDHAAAGEDLLLFQTLGNGLVRFLGEFVCAGYDLEQGPDESGAERQSIVFNLVPAAHINDDAAPPVGETSPVDLKLLRQRALEAVPTPGQANRAIAKRNVYERSRDIRLYVLARANGQCEACSRAAPFTASTGIPYLEPHHIRRLGDGGPDDPRFMAAIAQIVIEKFTTALTGQP